jgi:hypothetical protein
MRSTALCLAALALGAPAAAPAARKPAAPARTALSLEEQDACRMEVEALDRRRRLFEGQGLSPAEIARRNAASQAALDECVAGYRAGRTAELERLADLKELERRTGPDATEAQRAEAWAQIRRERLAAKDPRTLTDAERAELAAGAKAELAETHATLDTVHARDQGFMRMVHSALACYHGVRRTRLKDDEAHEKALAKAGHGNRTRLYALKSAVRESDEVLARSREAAKGFKDGLLPCGDEKVAVLAHCLAVRFDDHRTEPACESEEIQQYVRFIK